MLKFLEIKSLSPKEQEQIEKEIDEAVARRIEEGLLTQREIREIVEMKLRSLLDIQDVQSVYENHLFRDKK
ncbi:MAG: hypothetical protein ACERK6_04850 [Candidatus Aminicenantaceae bacterium]